MQLGATRHIRAARGYNKGDGYHLTLELHSIILVCNLVAFQPTTHSLLVETSTNAASVHTAPSSTRQVLLQYIQRLRCGQDDRTEVLPRQSSRPSQHRLEPSRGSYQLYRPRKQTVDLMPRSYTRPLHLRQPRWTRHPPH